MFEIKKTGAEGVNNIAGAVASVLLVRHDNRHGFRSGDMLGQSLQTPSNAKHLQWWCFPLGFGDLCES